MDAAAARVTEAAKPPRPPRPPLEARRARVAVAMLFFTNGAIFSSLLPRYPEIKADLDLTNAAFGLAVAAFPLGALIAGLTAGVLIRRFRSSRVAIGGTVLSAAGILFAGSSPTWAGLAAGLFVAGAMDAITDVAQNSHGLRVQRLFRRSILNSFHAVWSIGAVTGGVLGAAAAQLAVPRGIQLAVLAVVFSVVALATYRRLLPGPEPTPGPEPMPGPALTPGPEPVPSPQLEPSPETAEAPPARHPDSSRPTTPSRARTGRLLTYGVMLALVLIGASATVVEDAGSSWSAIYLSGSLGTSAFVAGIGFIALQGMQFIGRLFGDRLVDRFGQRAVARTGGLVVFIGMGVALAFPSVVGTIAGFGVAGLGVATLVPAAMHAADELPGFSPGTGLTILSWLLRLGFLLSPPIVGAIADASSLRLGLLVVPVAGLTVLVAARVLAIRPALRAAAAA